MNISQLSEFITNHPWLILAAVALTAMLIGGEIKRRLSGVRDVAPGEAVARDAPAPAALSDEERAAAIGRLRAGGRQPRRPRRRSNP